MGERLGEVARSWWAPAAGIVTAAVCWGMLYEQGRESAQTLSVLATAVQRIDVSVASTAEHVRGADERTADLALRVRELEGRGWPRR